MHMTAANKLLTAVTCTSHVGAAGPYTLVWQVLDHFRLGAVKMVDASLSVQMKRIKVEQMFKRLICLISNALPA